MNSSWLAYGSLSSTEHTLPHHRVAVLLKRVRQFECSNITEPKSNPCIHSYHWWKLTLFCIGLAASGNFHIVRHPYSRGGRAVSCSTHRQRNDSHCPSTLDPPPAFHKQGNTKAFPPFQRCWSVSTLPRSQAGLATRQRQESEARLQLGQRHLGSIHNGIDQGRGSEERMCTILKSSNLARRHPTLYQGRQYV